MGQLEGVENDGSYSVAPVQQLLHNGFHDNEVTFCAHAVHQENIVRK